MSKSCAIFGVSRGYTVDGYEIRLAQLKRTVKELATDGHDTFISPINIGYEMDIAEYIVDKLPQTNLIVTQPYREKSIHYRFRGQYEYVIENADKLVYISHERTDDANRKQTDWIKANTDCIVGISNQEGNKPSRITNQDSDTHSVILLPHDIDKFSPSKEELSNSYVDTENDTKQWEQHEDDEIRNEYMTKGMTIREIAVKHQRSESSVTNKMRRLYLIGVYDSGREPICKGETVELGL